MERRRFFKAFAALAATVVVAPSVLAKLKPEKHVVEGLDWSKGDALPEFDEFLEKLTRYQSGEKFMFCGQDTYEKLNKMATAKDIENHWGVSLTQIQTHHGKFHIMPTPYLNGEYPRFIDMNGSSPFVKLMSQLKSKPVKPKIEWTRKDLKW